MVSLKRRVVKWLKDKENRSLLGNIFLLGFFTVYLFLFIFFCSFLPILSTAIFQSFIEYSPLPQVVYYVTLFSYALGIVPVYGLLKVIIKIMNSKKLKNIIPTYIPLTLKKINFYFILSILMIYVVITVGLNIYQGFYKNDLPFSFDFGSNNYNLTISSDCKSEGGLSIFTEGDKVRCDIKINSKSDCDFRLNEIIVNDTYGDINETLFKESNVNKLLEIGYYKKEGSSLESISFTFQVKSTVLHNIYTFFRFDYGLCKDDDPHHLTEYVILNSTEKTYMPATREMYENIRNQRLAVLVLIFSVAIVSVLTSVKNLKDIIENHKKE